MIKQSDLSAIIDSQYERLMTSDFGLERYLLKKLPEKQGNHALIISGIRRCGKSTLLGQLIKKVPSHGFFINFDTPKLYNFEISDFKLLDLIIKENDYEHLFFDEIQVVKGWELYVRQKLDEEFTVVITGSNASLLSRELGTKLTGRHITKELFPFSYTEFIRFMQIKSNEESFQKYFETGGFPEFVKINNPDILTSLFDDILFRDISVRFGIRDVNSLKRLLLFLVANVGNLITATKLKQVLGIKSSATILDYFSYFEQTYLLGLLPKFSHSYRAQLINPRKIYIIDNGLINAVSPSHTKDAGKKLENIIYWHFRQQNKELFYYNETGSECDFVVAAKNKVEKIVQVCYELTPENSSREEKGLLEAMNFFNIDKGTIITMDQQDKIRHKNMQIDIIPAYVYIDNLDG
ncbi:MAG: ATP-binding protein [Bacteroidales bacterium]|nr:ATP-binding protein [Bacteroidales bacterium]